MEPVRRVADVLGGKRVLGSDVRSLSDLERVVVAGLPKRSLRCVALRALGPGAALNDLVYKVVPAATFKRRTRLSREESERTERLARVIALAESLWGNETDGRDFLNRPHPLLGGETPLEVARTEIGARRVERLLAQVEHGLAL